MLSQRRLRGVRTHATLGGAFLSIFQYNAATLSQIEGWLSRDRLTRYLGATGGDLESAVKNHVYNTALSSAFFGPIQVLEVALRNAFHRELTSAFGAAWYDEATFRVSPEITRSIDDAKEALNNHRLPSDAPHIVAALHFGFWTTLLAGRYEHQIWTPALNKAFPNYRAVMGKPAKRSIISGQIDYLRGLRNRIAHHEPIFHRDLLADYRTLLRVASWLSSELDKWIDYHSRILAVLPRREVY